MRGVLFAGILLIGAAASSGAFADDNVNQPGTQAITDCDRLAASPDDKSRPPEIAGVAFGDIDSTRAIAACEAAVAATPTSRFEFQLARSQDKAGDFGAAAANYLLAAKQGHLRAQDNLASDYDTGQGVPKSPEEAAKWFRLAAEQGDAGAQYNMGVHCFNGTGVPKSIAEAFKWWHLAYDQGEPNTIKAVANLADLYPEFIYGWKDKSRTADAPGTMAATSPPADIAADKSAWRGSNAAPAATATNSPRLAGTEYAIGDFPKLGKVESQADLGTVNAQYRNAAERPNVLFAAACYFDKTPLMMSAQKDAGDASTGDATSTDSFREAISLYQQAAQQGDTCAELRMAGLYAQQMYGNRNPDYDQSLYWYKQAISHGSVEAQIDVAEIFYCGQVVVCAYGSPFPMQGYRMSVDQPKACALVQDLMSGAVLNDAAESALKTDPFIKFRYPQWNCDQMIRDGAEAKRMAPVDKFLDALLTVDSKSWLLNHYVAGSARDSKIVARSAKPASVTVRTDFELTSELGNRPQIGWIEVTLAKRKITCLRYWDFPSVCKELGKLSPGTRFWLAAAAAYGAQHNGATSSGPKDNCTLGDYMYAPDAMGGSIAGLYLGGGCN
jgi:TPR repeat protein